MNIASRLGASTWSIEGLLLQGGNSVERQIELIASTGAEIIDLPEYHLGFDPHPNLHRLHTIRDTIKANGLELSGIFFHTDLVAATDFYSAEKVIADLQEYLAVAGFLGAAAIEISNGNLIPSLSEQEARDRLLPIYEAIIPTAEYYGVVVAINAARPLTVSAFKSPESALGIVKEFDSPFLRVTPDFECWRITREGMPTKYVEAPNAVRGLATPLEVFADCLPYARRIEAKLYEFDEDGNEPNFPVDELMAMVEDNGAAFDISIEYEGWVPEIHPERDAYEETVKAVQLLQRYGLGRNRGGSK